MSYQFYRHFKCFDQNYLCKWEKKHGRGQLLRVLECPTEAPCQKALK